MRVICNLNIRDNAANGINKLEGFINRKSVDNPSHNLTLLVLLEFSPGNQERIRSGKKKTQNFELSI